MRGMNLMTIVGRVGQEPELKTSKAGHPWMRLSIATNRGVKKDDEWVEETDWHKVQVFGRDAERVFEFVKKGDLIGVHGTMQYDSWTDEEGVRRTSAKLNADRIHFLESRKGQVAEA